MVSNFLKIFFLSFLIISCSSKGLKFTGNLQYPLLLKRNSNLDTFLEENKINAEYALICGKDGTAAYIFKKSFSEIELFQNKDHWNSIGNELPEVCNIKDLANISLFTRDHRNNIYILNNTDQESVLSPFEAEISQYKLLGKSRKNEHSVKKYCFEKEFRILTESDSILAIMKNGYEKWLFPNETGEIDCVELRNSNFACSRDTLVTLWKNPPIIDAFSLHEKIIKSDRSPSLYIFIDSYGWIFKEHIDAINHKGFLSQFDFDPLRVPYPPKTKNSYWTFGSGTSWRKRKKDEKYFSDILKMDQKGLIIEADRIFYPSSINHVMNTDNNNNGTIDDEIFEKAMEYFDSDLDFLLVHFHSLDNISHRVGAYTQERINTFKLLEEYTEQLTKHWNGCVFLFSDHGMHSEDASGDHNSGSAEDMIGIWGELK